MVEDESIIQTHGIVIDPTRWEVSIEGNPVTLTKAEFRLLYFLASRPGFDNTRQQIIDAIQGPDYPVTERSVDVQVAGLRKKWGLGAIDRNSPSCRLSFSEVVLPTRGHYASQPAYRRRFEPCGQSEAVSNAFASRKA